MCDVCPRYGAQPAECAETPPSQSHCARPKLLVIYARGCLLPNPAPRLRAEDQSGIPLSLPLAVFNCLSDSVQRNTCGSRQRTNTRCSLPCCRCRCSSIHRGRDRSYTASQRNTTLSGAGPDSIRCSPTQFLCIHTSRNYRGSPGCPINSKLSWADPHRPSHSDQVSGKPSQRWVRSARPVFERGSHRCRQRRNGADQE